ncbi:MAG: DeoR family transcriptional regulator [Solirubrobacterales bacterium]|nr:DeoR family transcriptional regulator [Solirubrobacterales bacterium]
MAQKATNDRERPVLAASRRERIVELLRDSRSVTVAELEREFGISAMTVRRDLAELERQGIARRTHGGAVLPDIAAHEDSFAQRLETATEEKRLLADAAIAMLSPAETIFLDSSTTSYFLARQIVERGIGLTVITNSLPVMDFLATEAPPGIDLIGAGGLLRRLTRSFVGPVAIAAVRGYFADRVFLSVKGVTADGTLTDADPLEAEVKRAMITQATEAVLLVDASKLSARGLSAIVPVSQLHAVLAHGVRGEMAAALRAPGVELRAIGEPTDGAGEPPTAQASDATDGDER